MANYTMTIMEMVNNNLTKNIFPNHYDFYLDDEQARKSFEDKFIKHYYYREIGFDSPFMFIQKLESHLLLNMPYWKQLYQTELEARGINFLLNKDLTESTTRELTGIESGTGNTVLTNEERQTVSSTSTNNGESSSIINGESSSTTSGKSSSSSTDEISTTSQTSTNNKTSQLSDGVSSVSLEEGYLTGVNNEEQTNTGSQDSQTTSNNTQEFTATNTQESTTNNTQESTTTNSQQSSGQGTQSQEETNRRENTQKETVTLLSQGNIGITSSAQLLKEWRDVLINMDKIIIESCNDLFMKIY